MVLVCQSIWGTPIRQGDEQARPDYPGQIQAGWGNGECIVQAMGYNGLEKGAGPAHAWTRQTERAPPLPESIEEGDNILTEPIEKNKYFSRYWKGFWDRDSPKYQEMLQSLVAIRFHAMDMDLPPIEPLQIWAAAKHLKLDTGLGIDLVDPFLFKNLSRRGAQELCDILNRIETEVMWPEHPLNLIVLMGKPGGGCRPIALMPMLYRLWTKIRRPYMRDWEADNKGPWDAAVRGSSALRAAILIAFADEMGTYSGLEVAKVFWDLEKITTP